MIFIICILLDFFFPHRLDVAMGINTMGALNIVNFAKNCSKLQMLLHVSTGKYNNKLGKALVIKEYGY